MMKRRQRLRADSILAKRFKEENGSLICRELLELGDTEQGPVPDKRTADYYQHRRCARLIENAGKMLDELIEIRRW